jgi:hypothetical protein
MPLSERQRRGRRAAGFHLRVLLSKPGPYRDIWRPFAHDAGPGEVNNAAVCQAIAHHLWDTGEFDDHDTGLPRRLKDKIGRALAGSGLTTKTLQWFKETFQLSPHDAQRVDELYRGDITMTEVFGRLPPMEPASPAKAPRHETTLLFEHHTIGRHGIPVRHHTQQNVRSLIDGLATYQVGIDTQQAEVRVRRGGAPGEILAIADGIWVVEITFPHPLRYGEERYLDYWTRLRYREPPPAEFRRGAHLPVQHLDMRLEFHPQRLPSKLWWAEWADYRDARQDIVDREEFSLDEEFSAHKYLESMERAVVGFYWEW